MVMEFRFEKETFSPALCIENYIKAPRLVFSLDGL